MTGPPTLKARPALHDMELARLAAAGDRAAFGELVRRHGSSVRALVRRMGAEPATADDVAQDAFIAAFERIGEFRGDGAFPAWVRRIAARAYVRRVRRAVQTTVGPEDCGEAALPGEGEAATRLDLDAALGALSTAERLCVSLCYGAGLTHAEAAEALAAPVGTVKSHVKRGLEKLRRRMGVAPSTTNRPAAPLGAEAEDEHHA